MRGLFDSQGVGAMSLSDPSQDPMGWLRKYRGRSLEDDAIDASGMPEVWQGYSERRAAEDEFGKYSKLAQAAAAEMAGLVPTMAAGSLTSEPSPIDVQNRFFDDWAAEGQRRRTEPDFSDVRSGSSRGSRPAIEEPGGWNPGGWSLEDAYRRSRNDGPVRMSPTLLTPGTAEIDRQRREQEEQARIERDLGARTPTYQQGLHGLDRVTPPGIDIPLMPGAGGSGPLPRSGSSPAPARPAIEGGPDFSDVRSGANTQPAIEMFAGGTSRRVDYPDGRREWISDPHKGSDGTDYGRASITAKPGASGPRGADFLRSGSALLSSPQRFSAGPPAIETASVVPAGARYDAMGNRVAAGGADQSAGHVANVGGGSDWRQEMALEEQRQAADLQRRAPALTRLQEQAKLAELHRAIDDPYALERLRAQSAATVEGIRGRAKVDEVFAKGQAAREGEQFRAQAYRADMDRIEADTAAAERAVRSIIPPGPALDEALSKIGARYEAAKDRVRTEHELAAKFRASNTE